MNTIMTIIPRKMGSVWVFDDEARGLLQEPFVGETNRIIDDFLKASDIDFHDAENRGFQMMFSGSPFPDHEYVLEYVRDEGGGAWYYDPLFGRTGWLCSALYAYFDVPPGKIYLSILGAEGEG